MKKGQRIKSVTQEKQFNVRLSVEQMEQLRRKAFDSNISISTIVRSILEKNDIISPTVIKDLT